jgi:Glycosyl hydrolase family 47
MVPLNSCCIVSQEISLFETNIRIVGGLLSAYDLSGDKVRARPGPFIGVHVRLSTTESGNSQRGLRVCTCHDRPS